jgi:DNA-binding transcriptional MerR regulator
MGGRISLRRATGRARVSLKTKEVLDQTGISRQMLYRYITAGLIREEEVTGSGRRVFADDVIKKIEIIRRLNESGYALRDIKDIFFDRT